MLKGSDKMITITRKDDVITFNGHSRVDICAAVSSIMYTTLNAMEKFDDESFDFNDDKEKDIVTIKIKYYTDATSVLITNMFDMLKDLQEDTNGEVIIKDTNY